MKTTKKNKGAMIESKKYVYFPFYIYDAMDEILGDDMIRIELSERQIKKVAQVMINENGGHPVDMDRLDWLQTIISNKIYTEGYMSILDFVDWDTDWYVVLLHDMPKKLVEYAEDYITFKNVTQRSYIDVDGKEEYYSFGYQISVNAYNTMKKVLTSKVDDRTDFDLLKEQYPEVYNEVAPDALEQGFKWAMSRYNVATTAYLKEFPVEIYREIGYEDVI